MYKNVRYIYSIYEQTELFCRPLILRHNLAWTVDLPPWTQIMVQIPASLRRSFDVWDKPDKNIDHKWI